MRELIERLEQQGELAVVEKPVDRTLEMACVMGIDESLEVDTADKTVTDLSDDSAVFTVLTVTGGGRRDWLPLVAGVNELEYTDTGTNGVTVTVEYEERYYE